MTACSVESQSTDLSPDIVSILQQLIAFPTVSRDSNLALIEWVEDYLTRCGVRSRLTYDRDRHKANLFATIGEGRQGGLVLSGHTDVVPVDGQAWSSDPFEARIDGQRLYGRGAADMKGFIAVALAAVPAMHDADLKSPIHLAFSYDEEVGCLGVRELLKDLHAQDIRPRGCIIGEPTEMKVVIGHKGGSVYRCAVHGREMHASLAPRGVNAIEYAAQLIVRLSLMQERLIRDEPRNVGFEIPHTTLSTGVIKGGAASNIVPCDCEFRLDVRYLPWSKPETIIAELEAYARMELLPRMQALAPEATISIEQTGDVPPLDMAEDADLTQQIDRLVGHHGGGRYVGFGTEGGLFQAANIPSVICGPGSIEQAHRPDEFVTLAQLARCAQFVDRLILEQARSESIH